MVRHENQAVRFETGIGSTYTAQLEEKFSSAINKAIDEVIDPLRANYRGLAIAVVARAVQDTTNSKKRARNDAIEYLLSEDCGELMRLCGIRWRITREDIDRISPPLPKIYRRGR